MTLQNNQTPETLGSLIGARGERIRWGRSVTFFLAILLSDSIATLLEGWMREPNLFHLVPYSYFLRLGLYPFVLTIVALMGFRFIRHEVVAAAVAALLYDIPMRGTELLLKVPHVSSGAGLAGMLLKGFLAEFLFLFGLLFFLRKVRPVWLALGLGSLAGTLVFDLLQRLLHLLTGPEGRQPFFLSFREELIGIGFLVVSAALFAYITWAGVGVVLARTRRLSTGFFLGSLIGCPALAVAVTGCGVYQFEVHRSLEASFPYVYGGMVFWCIYVAVLLTVVHKMWAAIQDGHARTTPGKAVGFLFIPFYGFYWVFQAFRGFAQDHNRYLARHSLNFRKLPEGLFLTFAIIAAFSWIPVVFAINLFIGPIMAVKACGAVNRLADSE